MFCLIDRARLALAIEEEIVGVQNIVAEELVDVAVKLRGYRISEWR